MTTKKTTADDQGVVKAKTKKKTASAGKKATTKNAKSAGKGKSTASRGIYKTAGELQKAIDAYFDSLLVPMVVYDKNLKERVIVYKDEAKTVPYMEQAKPPTVLGLCEFLGLSVQALHQNYETKDLFVDVITRARSKIERHWVELLVDKDSQRGAEFYLRSKCKYMTIDQEQALAIQRENVEISKRSLELQEAKLKGVQDDIDKMNGDLQTLKELITNPAPNRDLKDYE